MAQMYNNFFGKLAAWTLMAILLSELPFHGFIRDAIDPLLDLLPNFSVNFTYTIDSNEYLRLFALASYLLEGKKEAGWKFSVSKITLAAAHWLSLRAWLDAIGPNVRPV